MALAKHFLDVLPFDWSRQESQEFLLALSSAYPESDGIAFIARQAGVNLDRVNWRRAARDVWTDVIEELSRAGALRRFVRRALDDKAVAAYRGTFERLLEAPVQPDQAAVVELLTQLYEEKAASLGVLVAAQIPLEDVEWDRPMRAVWEQIVQIAHQRSLLLNVMNSVLDDPLVAGGHDAVRRLLKVRALGRDELGRISHVLVNVFPDTSTIETLLRESGVPLHHVYWDQGARYVWREAVEVARSTDKLFALLTTAQGQVSLSDPVIDEILGSRAASPAGEVSSG